MSNIKSMKERREQLRSEIKTLNVEDVSEGFSAFNFCDAEGIICHMDRKKIRKRKRRN